MSPSESQPAVPPLTLSDVIDADERVAVGGEIVPTHVRYVLGFDRPPTDMEIEVIVESLRPFDVVRSVTSDGVEVVTADREDPGRQIPHLRQAVSQAPQEAARRESARATQEKNSDKRSEGLREDLAATLDSGL